MKLFELTSRGFTPAMMKVCTACGGSGFTQPAYCAFTAQTNPEHPDPTVFSLMGGRVPPPPAPCTACIRGFVLAPLEMHRLLDELLENLIDFLEKPENHALRKRYIDLHITDVEQRLLGQTK